MTSIPPELSRSSSYDDYTNHHHKEKPPAKQTSIIGSFSKRLPPNSQSSSRKFRATDITLEAIKFQQAYCPPAKDGNPITAFRQNLQSQATVEVKKAYATYGKKLAMFVMALATIAVSAAFFAGTVASGGALPILLGLGMGVGVLLLAGLSKSLDKTKVDIKIKEGLLREIGGNHEGFLQSISNKYVYVPKTDLIAHANPEDLINAARKNPKNYSFFIKEHPETYKKILLDKDLRAKWKQLDINLRLKDQTFEHLKTIVERDIADIDYYLAEKYNLFRTHPLKLKLPPVSEPEWKREVAANRPITAKSPQIEQEKARTKKPERLGPPPASEPTQPQIKEEPIIYLELELSEELRQELEEEHEQKVKAGKPTQVQPQPKHEHEEEEPEFADIQLGPRESQPHQILITPPLTELPSVEEPLTPKAVKAPTPPSKSQAEKELEQIYIDLSNFKAGRSPDLDIYEVALEASETLEELKEEISERERVLFNGLKRDINFILKTKNMLEIISSSPLIEEDDYNPTIRNYVNLKRDIQTTRDLEKENPDWYRALINSDELIEKEAEAANEISKRKLVLAKTQTVVEEAIQKVQKLMQERAPQAKEIEKEIAKLKETKNTVQTNLEEAGFSSNIINKQITKIDNTIKHLQEFLDFSSRAATSKQPHQADPESNFDETVAEAYIKLNNSKTASDAYQHLKNLKQDALEVFNALLNIKKFELFGNIFRNKPQPSTEKEIYKLNNYIRIEKTKLESLFAKDQLILQQQRELEREGELQEEIDSETEEEEKRSLEEALNSSQDLIGYLTDNYSEDIEKQEEIANKIFEHSVKEELELVLSNIEKALRDINISSKLKLPEVSKTSLLPFLKSIARILRSKIDSNKPKLEIEMEPKAMEELSEDELDEESEIEEKLNDEADKAQDMRQAAVFKDFLRFKLAELAEKSEQIQRETLTKLLQNLEMSDELKLFVKELEKDESLLNKKGIQQTFSILKELIKNQELL